MLNADESEEISVNSDKSTLSMVETLASRSLKGSCNFGIFEYKSIKKCVHLA